MDVSVGGGDTERRAFHQGHGSRAQGACRGVSVPSSHVGLLFDPPELLWPAPARPYWGCRRRYAGGHAGTRSRTVRVVPLSAGFLGQNTPRPSRVNLISSSGRPEGVYSEGTGHSLMQPGGPLFLPTPEAP